MTSVGRAEIEMAGTIEGILARIGQTIKTDQPEEIILGTAIITHVQIIRTDQTEEIIPGAVIITHAQIAKIEETSVS